MSYWQPKKMSRPWKGTQQDASCWCRTRDTRGLQTTTDSATSRGKHTTRDLRQVNQVLGSETLKSVMTAHQF